MEIGWRCCAGCGRRAPNYNCNRSLCSESHSAWSTSLAWRASELRLISGSTTTSCVYSFWPLPNGAAKLVVSHGLLLDGDGIAVPHVVQVLDDELPNRDGTVSLQVVVVPLKVDAKGKLRSKMPPCSSHLISPPRELLDSQILKGPEIGVIVALNVGWLSAPEGAIEQNL